MTAHDVDTTKPPANEPAFRLTFSPQELVELTGYRQSAKQLEVLHRAGFFRARLFENRDGVLLERAHYEAVCCGKIEAARPKVLPPPNARRHGSRAAS